MVLWNLLSKRHWALSQGDITFSLVGSSLGGDAQAQAVELLCRCDDIADDGVELRVLKGLLTAATSSHIHLHGQARPLYPYKYWHSCHCLTI